MTMKPSSFTVVNYLDLFLCLDLNGVTKMGCHVLLLFTALTLPRSEKSHAGLTILGCMCEQKMLLTTQLPVPVVSAPTTPPQHIPLLNFHHFEVVTRLSGIQHGRVLKHTRAPNHLASSCMDCFGSCATICGDPSYTCTSTMKSQCYSVFMCSVSRAHSLPSMRLMTDAWFHTGFSSVETEFHSIAGFIGNVCRSTVV